MNRVLVLFSLLFWIPLETNTIIFLVWIHFELFFSVGTARIRKKLLPHPIELKICFDATVESSLEFRFDQISHFGSERFFVVCKITKNYIGIFLCRSNFKQKSWNFFFCFEYFNGERQITSFRIILMSKQ